MKRKRVLTAIAILLALAGAYGLYEWLRPMTPGEVVLAYEWGRRSEDVGQQKGAMKYLADSARSAYSVLRESEGWKVDIDTLRMPTLWSRFWHGADSPAISIDSERVDGDTAVVVCYVSNPQGVWGIAFGEEGYSPIRYEYRLGRKGNAWVVSHGESNDMRAYHSGGMKFWKNLYSDKPIQEPAEH